MRIKMLNGVIQTLIKVTHMPELRIFFITVDCLDVDKRSIAMDVE